MPATLLSHQALVLPLKLRWPRVFSGLALCLGSMAPDLAFIGRMTDDSVFSHTVTAQFLLTIPVTMVLVWVVTTLLIPTLLPYLRDVPSLRLHDLAALEPPHDARSWTGVAISAWIGGMSHVLLDAITHGNHSGWLVPKLPFLRTPVPFFGGPVPLYDALQCWLTILLAVAAWFMWRRIASGRLLWHWRARDVQPAPRMPRASGTQLVVLCLIAGAQGAVTGYSMYDGRAFKGIAAALGFGALDFIFGALVITAVGMRVARVDRVSAGDTDALSQPLGIPTGLPS